MPGFRKSRLSSVSGAASVVVVGVGAGDMGQIREILGTEAVLPPDVTPYPDAIVVVHKTRPDVVIVGFDDDFQEAIRLGPLLQQELPGVHLIALAQQPDAERIRSAMRAGFREYIVLPDDNELLRRAVHEAAYASGMDEDRGEVVAVCGTKGGCGVTLLTVNLAAELSPVHRVLCVDLDFSMGDVAAFLDLSPSNSISDVIHNIQRLDERLLGGSVAVHHSKVHVLAQPHEPEDEEFGGDIILRLLHACAKAYQYVLVDCGGRIDEPTLTTLSVADLVLLVCTPDVPSVRNAWRRLKLLDKVGIERDRIRLVVNRWTRNAPISRKDIETNLGIDVAATIANDSKTTQPAVNEGRLLREVNRRSAAVKDVGRMVGIITEGVQKVAPSESSGRWIF